MYQYKGLEDTIAAIATAIGQGGIGIIRLSGPKSFEIADEIFTAQNGHKPSKFKNFTVHHGWVIKKSTGAQEHRPQEIIDEVLLTVMHAPKSYTTEDMVEVSCHGGVVVLKTILSLIIEKGARLAEPGEFTKRAFLNGRIDLVQAEAVLDIIQAKTDAFLRVSTHQLKGELSVALEKIRGQLMAVYIEIEAILNFPEDDIDAKKREVFFHQLLEAKKDIERLVESGEQGKVLKEGIRIVICGRTNVGKSSLLNVLLKEPRAIVSPIAGTTRDTIEETVQIRGIPFQLVDTAGILSPRNEIEQEAVKRSQMYIQAADLGLLMLDSSEKLNEEDESLIKILKDQNTLVVLNKSDLPATLKEVSVKALIGNKRILKTSVLHRQGIEELEEAIVANVWQGKIMEPQGILISNIRHIQALKDAALALEKACAVFNDKLALEFASEEIKRAVNFLDAITGRNIDTDLLDNIFSQFCIGK